MTLTEPPTSTFPHAMIAAGADAVLRLRATLECRLRSTSPAASCHACQPKGPGCTGEIGLPYRRRVRVREWNRPEEVAILGARSESMLKLHQFVAAANKYLPVVLIAVFGTIYVYARFIGPVNLPRALILALVCPIPLLIQANVIVSWSMEVGRKERYGLNDAWVTLVCVLGFLFMTDFEVRLVGGDIHRGLIDFIRSIL